MFFIIPAYAGRISGLITDENNEPLPFVSVFVQGTSIGTTANIKGEYFLDVAPGKQTIMFRCIGYTTESVELQITNEPVVLNLQMKQQPVSINQVTITAGGEDPAYGVIRKAQNMRKHYLQQVKAFSYDSYIKGMTFLRNVPEKILGQDIVLEGLDSSRSGIVYLSESVSKVHFEEPDKRKEVMISSKVSGRSQGFSWNSALEFQLDFYEPLIATPVTDRNVVSPIAPNAMTYYRYKLLGEFTEHGKTVYQIEVKPKVTGSPLVNGILNIQDSTWRVHSLDMFLTGKNGMNYLDTLRMKVIFIPVTEDVWMKGSQNFTFNFDLKLFQLKGDGNFSGVFSNYNLDPQFPRNFFSSEIMKVEEESNQKSDQYWDSIRPVPLTELEAADYLLKDSIEKVKSTKEYKDSVDRIRNRFKIINLVYGYSFRNSWKGIEVFFSSPFRELHFNTVEGLNITQRISFGKFHEKSRGRTEVSAAVRYGFNGGRLYYKGIFRHRFNYVNKMTIGAEGGTYIFQFNPEQPITESQNDLHTIFFEENFIKLYEKSYGRISWGAEVVNGIQVETSLEFARRRARINSPNLLRMFIDWDNRAFASNNPRNELDDAPFFQDHNALIWDIHLRFKFGQKYMLRPGRKINYRSKWPTLDVQIRKAIPGVGINAPSFTFLYASLMYDIPMGILGSAQAYAGYGMFVERTNIPFVDFHHFNTTRTFFAPRNTLNSFWALPYYRYSTGDKFVEAHYQHNFRGWLLGKIPGIKRLKWHEVVGFHFLWTPVLNDYYEFNVGIANIFRIIRADFVGGFGRHQPPYFSGRLKINF